MLRTRDLAIFRGLTARLVLLMSLAMLPLGLISVFQTAVVVKEAQALSRAALRAETVAAAASERELIERAIGAAQGIGSAVATLPVDECEAKLRRFAEDHGTYIFAGLIQPSGLMACSSTGDTVDFSDSETLASVLQQDGPVIDVRAEGAVTGRPVVIITHPIRIDGTLFGLLSISIPHETAHARMNSDNVPDGLALVSLTARGEIIAASGHPEHASDVLPRDIAPELLATMGKQDLSGIAGDGSQRYFSVVPMIDDTFVLIGSWPASGFANGTAVSGARLAVLFPILMWVAAIAVAIFGLQRLVVRHVKQLRSGMRQFALGERSARGLTLDNPPAELEEAERAFNRMALLISDAEARREIDLQDKEVLLREVHHRVKNNLQLIASIMNMQMRAARSSETKQVLAGLQRRVRGLATLHRSLYTTPDMTTMDAAEVIRTVIADVSNLVDAHQQRVTSDLISAPLYPDQAVPLSMLVSEALTNAFKYAPKEAGALGTIAVSLVAEGDRMLRLEILNRVSGARAEDDTTASGDGLGKKLITAFVRQLDGTHDVRSDADSYSVCVTFPRREFVASDPDAQIA